ncbi:MAG: insulinase family protein [Deltaproteobacteria bacterium]|nr:MAG: insulinase family protein [Deltaproteobacteria bacterium]
MRTLSYLMLPLLLGLPAVSLAQAPDEVIEVIGDAPSSSRPKKPNMSIRLPDFNLDSQIFDFPTGLRILMQSDRTHPIVSVLMIVDHGAGDDPPGKNGTAHFVEHTWFRSVHGDLPPIMTLIQDIGAQFNATTRPDTTDYRTVASSEFLPLLLRLESKRLTAPYRGMTEDQVETEREVVRNEWRRRNEQSSSLAFDYLLKSVFPEGHPYHGRETNESLDAIDLETLQQYFDDYYTPDKTTLVVVGDFDRMDAFGLILENFDLELLHPDLKPEHIVRVPRPGIDNPDPENPEHYVVTAVDPANPEQPFQLAPFPPPRITEKTEPLPPPPPKGAIAEYKAAVDNRTVLVGWALPGGFRGNDTEMNVLALLASNVVAGSLGQRGLLDTPNKPRGLKDPGCFVLPMKVHSVLACAVEVTDLDRYPKPEKVADILIDQFSILNNQEQSPFLDMNFAEARLETITGVLQSVDDVAQHFGGRAEDIGFHFHQTGSALYHTDRMNEVNRIEMYNVIGMGDEYLKRDRAAIVVVDPIPPTEVDRTAETSSYHGASDADAVNTGRTTAATDEEIEASYVKPQLGGLVDRKLRNGMRVVIVPHSDAPLVQATLVVGGGSGMEPKGMFSYLSRFTDDAWRSPGSNAGNHALQVASTRTGGATSVNWSSGVRAPAGNLDSALWFLREEMETKSPDMAGRPTYVKRRRESFFRSIHSRSWHMQDMAFKHVYPDDSQKWVTQHDDIERMSEWRKRDVDDALTRMIQPENATLLIVGNVDADEALRLSVDYFAGWEQREGAEVGKMPRSTVGPLNQGHKVLVFDNPKRTQTQVTRSCRLNTSGVRDMQAAAVLSNYIFDQTFTQLRVKEALAYSPGGFASVSPDGSGSMTFSSLAVNIGVGRTLEFFRDLTDKLEKGEADDSALTMYKMRRARSHGVEAQSTRQLTSKLTSALTWEQPWSMLLDAGRDIAKVDAASIQRLVSGCNDRSITTLEGPAEVIEPQLKEKGFDYEIVDWEARGEEVHQAADPKGFAKRQKKKEKAEKKKAKEKAKKGESDDSDES